MLNFHFSSITASAAFLSSHRVAVSCEVGGPGPRERWVWAHGGMESRSQNRMHCGAGMCGGHPARGSSRQMPCDPVSSLFPSLLAPPQVPSYSLQPLLLRKTKIPCFPTSAERTERHGHAPG